MSLVAVGGAEMEIRDLFESIQVRESMGSDGIEVFPLDLPWDLEASYVLFDELLEQMLVEITEVSESGSVPELVVINDSDTDALILDGTELHGAKQDRMVNITLIIGKHSRETIPVSCVEVGRWSYKSRDFSSSKRTVASGLRRSKARSVYRNLEMSGTALSDQEKVWDEVSAYQMKSGSRSRTGALSDAVEAKAVEIERITTCLKDIDAHGAIVALNGKIECMDLITHRPTFRKLWLGLRHGYAMEAVLEKEHVPTKADSATVREWLRNAGRTIELTPHKVPGTGECFSCQGSRVSGGVVEHLGQIVHVMLFPVE